MQRINMAKNHIQVTHLNRVCRTLLLLLLFPMGCLMALNTANARTHANSNADILHVTQAHIKPTIATQTASVATFVLIADEDVTLLDWTSPMAAVVQLHTMRQEGDIMLMRHVPQQTLSAKKPLTLTRQGMHLMLFDLKNPLKAGDLVPIEVAFTNKKGVRSVFSFFAAVQQTQTSKSGATTTAPSTTAR